MKHIRYLIQLVSLLLVVDAVEQKGMRVESMAREELPEEMKEMSSEERLRYVETKKKQRGKLQKQINEISSKRDAYVLNKQNELAGNEDTLRSQVEQVVKKQAKEKGYSFKGSRD